MDKKSINLLQQRGAPPTFWERFYDWVSDTARVIVIITEILVLGAFGWRFILERRLTTLEDDIEMKGETLKTLAVQEDEIRTLQSRIESYKQIWNQSSNFAPIFTEVNSFIPSETEKLSFSITNSSSGKTLYIGGELARSKIETLENELKNAADFSDVTVLSIEKKSGGTDIYTFTITANIIFSVSRAPLTSENSESTT